MYNKDNIFAKIIKGQLPAKKVYEDDKILALHDIHPVAPTHILVLPKGEYIDFTDFIMKASSEDVQHYFNKIAEIIKELGLEENSYRLVTNKGSQSGQSVFHFHTHIISGRRLTELAG